MSGLSERILGQGGRDRAATWRTFLARRQNDPSIPLMERLNYFWMALVFVILVANGVSATMGQRTLWDSWRGPEMALLSLAYIGWYLGMIVIGRRAVGWPPPRRIAYPYLVVGFVVIALLLPFGEGYGVLLFALMGMTFGLLAAKEAPLPVGVAALMYLGSSGVLPLNGQHFSLGDVAQPVFSTVTSVGIVCVLAALVRERYHREHLFQELNDAHQRLRLSAAKEADLATLRERNRLAREMHDSLGHALVSIAIKLEAVQRLYAVDAARAVPEMEETKALVRATMTELRHSLQGLRPAALEEQPLGEALEEMTREMGHRTGVTAICTVDERAQYLDRRVQEALYRVGQEALTNVAKHAHARHVLLSLAVQDGAAVLGVSDDGVGLSAARRNETGQYGVQGMRERIDALGGVLTLGPRPEGGTVLRATVPAGENT